MTRTSVPQSYLVSPGTLMEDFESVGVFTTTGATAVADTVNFKTGTQGINVTATSTGGTAILDKVINVDHSDMQVFSLWVYIPDPTMLATMTIYFTQDTFTNYFFKDVDGFAKMMRIGWNLIRINHDEWSKNGSPTWSVNQIKMRLRFTAVVGQLCSITYDSFYKNPKGIASCLFTFDDGYAGTINNGLPYLSARGIKATTWVISDLVQSTNTSYMRKSDLDTLFAAGWDICNHTKDHADLSTLSVADMTTELQTCRDWLRTNGYKYSADYLCYPLGTYNPTIFPVLQSLEVKLARATHYGLSHATEDLRTIRVIGLDPNTVLSTVKALIDNAIIGGMTIMFMIHDTVASGATGSQMLISMFQSIVDYVVERKIRTMTISEWYNGIQNPRPIAIQPTRT